MKKTKKFLSLLLAFTLAMSMAVTGSCSEEGTTEAEASESEENGNNEKNLRRIPLENASNFRDLGGYPTEDGKVTKWGILYRSDKLSNLTDEEWDVLNNLGVETIIDLRGDSESEADPITPNYTVDYEAISLMNSFEDPDDSTDAAESQFAQSMQTDYTSTLFGNLPGMVEILDVILEKLSSGEGSVVFLCSAGKDRTGITAALLLYLCGVSREDIVADYMVSSNYNGGVDIDRVMSAMPEDMLSLLPEDETELMKVLGSEPETITELLDAFESEDIRECLAENGFGEEKQAELVALMTE